MGTLLALGLIVGFVWVVIKAVKDPGPSAAQMQSAIEQAGASIQYRYGNSLGLDPEGGKVYAMGQVIHKSEIRSLEKESIMETKSNAWGYQFHKDKHCKLVIHTRSLDTPTLVVPFGKKSDMDEWYSRLGVFCGLS